LDFHYLKGAFPRSALHNTRYDTFLLAHFQPIAFLGASPIGFFALSAYTFSDIAPGIAYRLKPEIFRHSYKLKGPIFPFEHLCAKPHQNEQNACFPNPKLQIL